MKTKMKLHLIIYITIVGFLTACENEIPYNPGQQDPQIIMNALLETGQAENDVYLHLGEGYSIEHLNEATLSLHQWQNSRNSESGFPGRNLWASGRRT